MASGAWSGMHLLHLLLLLQMLDGCHQLSHTPHMLTTASCCCHAVLYAAALLLQILHLYSQP
jgi:hypothetical protein